jgi:hypothetical protein
MSSLRGEKPIGIIPSQYLTFNYMFLLPEGKTGAKTGILKKNYCSFEYPEYLGSRVLSVF